jgi:nucleoside-diphosphate-sugar epimerase
MKIFITGATGFLGEAVVKELIGAGHQIVGLARSDESAAKLKALGATAHRGSLEDFDALQSGARESDGVIHLAFVHNFADFAGSLKTDLQAVKALGEGLKGSNKPLLTVAHANGAESDKVVMELAKSGVRASVVSLAPSVHDNYKFGFVSQLVAIARDKGVSAYVDDGANRWSAVHRLDAARLFSLALKSAPTGSYLDGVGDEAIPFKTIAEAVSKKLNLPTVSISRNEATAHFGFLGAIVSADLPRTNAATRDLLNWQPTHLSLLGDLAQGEV